MPARVEDYALIGDCHTAALIARDGSIDWLCLPRFDSGACFSALLGTPANGRWLVSPADAIHTVRRQYRADTLVLETDFETENGTVTLTDCMPIRTEEPHLVRVVRGRRGKVPMRMELIMRFDYGSIVPWVQRINGGVSAIAGPDRLLVRGSVPFCNKDFRTTAEFSIKAGQTETFVLTWHPSFKPPPQPIEPFKTVKATEKWWRQWTSRSSYNGPWQAAVHRSLITLKALTYAPSGGMVAAPTTSLPEFIGGVRNWDYRYCWLRDATFTLFALTNTGYMDEARAWRDWLVRAIAGQPASTQIMYGLAGERRLTEYEIPWLSGYEGSQPVRVGNAASQQFQLDVYGEVIDALFHARMHGLEPHVAGWGIANALLEFLASAWTKPDEGIWEVRGPRRHFTHSKIMAWVAFDRAVKVVEHFRREAPVDQWRQTRDAIHRHVCTNCFDPELNAFVQSCGSRSLDASLLMIPLVGFLSPSDSRVRGTVAAIERDLFVDGFVRRYIPEPDVDGLPPGEGSFLPCTFWFADNLYLQGRQHDAVAVFERLLDLRNDVGLLSEEYDIASRRLVGNFPQAFSHVGLVNTALNLSPQPGPAEERALY